MSETILETQDLTKEFKGFTAVDSVNLQVRRGHIHALLGPNGAGKSSMLNCINGVYQPQQGEITLRGKTYHGTSPRQVAERGVARTFQNLALFKGMSVLDNIMTGRNLRMKRGLLWQALHVGPARREETEQRAVVERIIDFLEIQAHRKTPVGRLPYGLQKRVDLGRALAMEPQVLLLDEITEGLAPVIVQTLGRVIRALKAKGLTIILVEQNFRFAAPLADRHYVMEHGRIVATVNKQELSAKADMLNEYLGV